MAKHEQILVLDPPSDLKFKGRLSGTRPSRAGAGGRRRRRGGRAVLPSPTPGPSVGAAAPLRLSAPGLAVCRCPAGLQRGGEGAGQAPRRAQPGTAAILRPAGAPREPARALPARQPAWRPSPRAAAVRSEPCGPAPESKSSGVCGRQRAPAGGVQRLWAGAARGRGAHGLARSLSCQMRDSGETGDPGVSG